MSDQELVRISSTLIPAIDRLIDSEKDGYGVKKFSSRRAVVDEAVRCLLDKTKGGKTD